jgi:hypothetical protein
MEQVTPPWQRFPQRCAFGNVLISGQFQSILRFMLAGAPLTGAVLPVPPVEVPG